MASGTGLYRRVVIAYDWGYRLVHRLDRPAACIGPVLRVERCRLRGALQLADGTQLRPGIPIGVLHLDNKRVLALHTSGLRPGAIGFEFRRLFLISLQTLAAGAAEGGPLAPLGAYAATTLFHRRLPALGFTSADGGDRSVWRHLVTRYERALLSSLHPAGTARLGRGTRTEARQLWISRAMLLARFRTAAAR